MKVTVYIKGTDEKREFEPAEVFASDSNTGTVTIDNFGATLKEFGPECDEDYDRVVIKQ